MTHSVRCRLPGMYEPDAMSDAFTLGWVLYEILCSEVSFPDLNDEELVDRRFCLGSFLVLGGLGDERVDSIVGACWD